MITFAEADVQYTLVKQRYQSGALSDEQYDAQLRELMVMDDLGRWWAKSRENGAWHYYDSATENWRLGAPPVAAPNDNLVAPGPMARTSVHPAAVDSVDSGAQSSAPAGAPANQDGVYDFDPLPELSGSLKIIFFVVSLLVPFVGFVLFLVYRKKPAPADRSAARVFLILGVVSLVFFCLGSVTILLLESLILGARL